MKCENLKQPRNAAFDNLRLLLIILVVFGHMLEIIRIEHDEIREILYFWIYTFHMPAFLFLSGYFAKFSWKRILRYTLIYFLFQTLYCLFDFLVLGKQFALQYVIPYWLLWYLPVMIYCCCLIPFLERANTNWRIIIIAGSVLLSLLAGYCGWIGYPLSLSRFFVFLPYFIVGYYFGRKKAEAELFLSARKNAWMCPAVVALILTCGLYLSGKVSKLMLYGSYPYSIGYNPLVRFLLFVTGLCWIVGLVCLFTSRGRKQVVGVTVYGENTLSIFLLHGFLIRIINHFRIVKSCLILSMIVTVGIVVVLGNPFVGKCFDDLFRFQSRKPNLKN